MTKQEIVQAAFRVWSGRFYKKTSLSQLAQELGVTKPALYKHFKNKEALCDAMFLDFFDRCAACAEPYYQKAMEENSSNERLLLINNAFIDFYIHNRDDFIFFIIMVHGNEKYKANIVEQLRIRCVDLQHIMLGAKADKQGKTNFDNGLGSDLLRLSITTSVCLLASFHGDAIRGNSNPGEQEIAEFSQQIVRQIKHGLNFNPHIVSQLEWAAIEKKIEDCAVEAQITSEQKIMKSIADVVSIEGPWKTSMKMIAEKLGLSKSSLYFHFENKLDMMRRLFCIMSEDIIKRTQYVITFSSVPEEQLYFAIMGIVSYLKLKPEILVLLDWIRIRSTEFDVQPEEAVSSKCKEELLNIKRIHTMFSEIRNADNEALIDDTKTDCILFLIINLLMRRPAGMSFAEISNDSFRLLYKFIALGIENNI